MQENSLCHRPVQPKYINLEIPEAAKIIDMCIFLKLLIKKV